MTIYFFKAEIFPELALFFIALGDCGLFTQRELLIILLTPFKKYVKLLRISLVCEII